MRKLKMEEVEFFIEAEQDDVPVRGNAIASGDDEFDEKVENEIIERLNSGDIWAWASVCVYARWKSFRGNAYLGCCSYESEQDFKANSGYYGDMKDEALDDLNSRIEEVRKQMMTLLSPEDFE